ncbi:hypothetical protein [Romboutsia lituseburensis]|uniref:Uncharacterized protein n=1 Tax=Romboutsia lituseburensis DSM 797 TaxID=1121325 RepID=A0A1G9SYW9_9FIRM|nr:hypothetical protein [Romboutsia lituseburensis]CEH35974.1 Hypothetical protein RLITU_3411 [Romboutsia lituseburensis]SDM40592.1 hypothetical protein SAMN04515677_11130 [Romboutsia lituseburensis DSM 797]
MTMFILIMVMLVPFTLALTAYGLTNGFVFNENYEIDENNAQDIVTLNNSVQLCFENIA